MFVPITAILRISNQPDMQPRYETGTLNLSRLLSWTQDDYA